MPDERSIAPLKDYLRKVPAITGAIGSGFSDGNSRVLSLPAEPSDSAVTENLADVTD